MLVSVIIPCFNVEEYIADAMESALAQTYRPIEIIVVDNNSTDNTLEILHGYQKKFPELITILEEKKQGAPAARNKGMKLAKGEWFQFLDADDILSPKKIENQIELISKNKEGNPISLVVGNYRVSQLSGELIKISVEENENFFEILSYSALGQTSSNLFNGSKVKRLGGWDETLTNGQDLDFEFRLLTDNYPGKAIYDTSYNTVYRMRKSGQITSLNPLQINSTLVEIRCKQYNYLRNNYTFLFQDNLLLFNQMLYYSIYRLGIYDVRKASKVKFEYLGEKYFPAKKTGYISRHHVFFVKTIGFRPYMALRYLIKNNLLKLFPKGIGQYSKYKFRRLYPQ